MAKGCPLDRSARVCTDAFHAGTVFKVFVDTAEGGVYYARTEHDSPEVDNDVLISTSAGRLRIGDFAEVRITEAREHELIAVPA